MKRFTAVLCFLLLLAAASFALGEISVVLDPENPRVGDYVEVKVIPDRENPQEVSYMLLSAARGFRFLQNSFSW